MAFVVLGGTIIAVTTSTETWLGIACIIFGIELNNGRRFKRKDEK